LPPEAESDGRSGLGLSLVKALIRQVEGRLEIHRGAGTRVAIHFDGDHLKHRETGSKKKRSRRSRPG
jgi:two-component sensor histidine kinase